MNRLLLSEKELAKLFVMTILSVTLFGLPGLFGMMLMQWITRQSYAVDQVDKHGIGEAQASRLGGAVIIGCSVVLLLVDFAANGSRLGNGPLGVHLFAWLACLSCAFLGLLEDIQNDSLKPRFRLLFKALVFLVTIGFWPDLVPSALGIPGLDMLLAYPPVAWLMTVIFCVGFLNATNMADGANGLMPGIFFIAFLVFSLESDAAIYSILATTTGFFLIFNVISGRLFLGDAGSYGLGTVAALSGLILYSTDTFSVSFLAVLFGYPCIELIVSMLRRSFSGRSMFLPDNDHFHNRLYFHLSAQLHSKTMANSLTGLIITAASSGVALTGYLLGGSVKSEFIWAVIFIAQCLAYGSAYYFAGRKRSLHQSVTG
jgi:UDP-GlcNAc:undecaprenyl-phosphate GlcNAc-1-phosphate transferase